METIAYRIKRHRAEKELTQRQFAERIARPDEDLVSLVRNVQRWESGTSAPRSTQLARIAQELGVQIDDLLADEAVA